MAKTQKDALEEILNTFDGPLSRPLRLLFLSDWMEDINWHTENRMLWETVSEPTAKAAQELHERINELKESTESRVTVAGVPGIERSPLMYEIKKLGYYHAFNLIFGWGLDESFDHTQGKEMVTEVMKLAGLPFKNKEDEAPQYLKKILSGAKTLAEELHLDEEGTRLLIEHIKATACENFTDGNRAGIRWARRQQ